MTATSAPRRILVVDDDRDICETMTEILALEGHEPRGALSGAAALGLVEDAPYDLILLDMRMPGMDGLETLARLRARVPGTPVVLHTAYAFDERVRLALEQGAVDVVIKPVELPRLREVLERHASRREG